MGYHTSQICINGHLITSTSDTNTDKKQNYCSLCGSKTIEHCPLCHAPIHGRYEIPGVITLRSKELPPPFYCHDCGKPYPWTESALESTKLLIREDEEFSCEQIESLIESLPDIISDTPRTNLASIQMKKALVTAGKFTAEALRQFAIDFGCALAKKSLGL